MNIIDALRSPQIFRPLFRDLATWRAWEVYLRALFGLGIDDPKDKRTFKDATGLKIPPREKVRESFVICGRRSGKSYISAVIAAYLAAFKDWKPYLSPGEKGWIFIIANDKQQAGIIKAYISGIFQRVACLKALIEKETVETDRYAAEYATAAWRECGITARNSDLTASEIYINFLPLISNGTAELLDLKRLAGQLAGLERRARTGGKDLVMHYPGGHDDCAVSAAGACIQAAGRGGEVRIYGWGSDDSWPQQRGIGEAPICLSDTLKRGFFR